MNWLNILLFVLISLCVALVVVFFIGRRMQKRQAEAQPMIDAAKQTVSILTIDKKRLRAKDSGLPKMVTDQIPWYAKRSKLPIVKAKVGAKIVTMIADDTVFDLLPVKTEAKVVISGIYIMEVKSVRGGIPPLPKKKGFLASITDKLGGAAKKEEASKAKNKKK